MKKLFAILLLSVYLFNLAGYSVWFQHLITESDSQFVNQLDNSHYNEQELMEIKVPLNMPYISSTGAFERIDGEISYKGVRYNYVKRKVTNDTLYILCLPNKAKTQLYNAKAAYSKETNDIPSNKKTTQTSKKAGFDTEHKHSANTYIDGLCLAPAVTYPSSATTRLHTAFIAIPEQPPRTISC